MDREIYIAIYEEYFKGKGASAELNEMARLLSTLCTSAGPGANLSRELVLDIHRAYEWLLNLAARAKEEEDAGG